MLGSSRELNWGDEGQQGDSAGAYHGYRGGDNLVIKVAKSTLMELFAEALKALRSPRRK